MHMGAMVDNTCKGESLILHKLNILVTWNDKIMAKSFAKFEDDNLITNVISEKLTMLESASKRAIEEQCKETGSSEWAERWSGIANLIIILDNDELIRTRTTKYTTMITMPYVISQLSTALLRSLDSLVRLRKVDPKSKLWRDNFGL